MKLRVTIDQKELEGIITAHLNRNHCGIKGKMVFNVDTDLSSRTYIFKGVSMDVEMDINSVIPAGKVEAKADKQPCKRGSCIGYIKDSGICEWCGVRQDRAKVCDTNIAKDCEHDWQQVEVGSGRETFARYVCTKCKALQ